MLKTKIATVIRAEALDVHGQLLEIDVEGEKRNAFAYTDLSGLFAVGDQALVNVTATALKLGTGGYDFAITNLSRPSAQSADEPGHIMK
ncbi:MAG: DUF3866 family protein, partial [Armatimonadota bacterium]